MSRVDYSKWDHIELSDDEDDTHPNIDTPSLFRWRHQARVERMAEAEKEKETFKKSASDHQQKMQEIKQKIAAANNDNTDELKKLKLEMSELEKQNEDFEKKEMELKKKERLTPLNIDTICKDGKSKTIINKYNAPKPEEASEEEKAQRMEEFTKKNEALIKKYGMMKRYEDSQTFLSDHLDLVCEETANYLVIWCVNLQCEDKSSLMEHVAHQTIVMQFILQLATSLELHPQSCVRPFFSRIKLAEKQYMDAFNDELKSFKQRVRERAEVRLQRVMAEIEEEERQKRLGPGGLDPVEVMESLPEVLRTCFETQDIAMLQEAVTKLPKEEAEHHIKRCIDSGLWVPGGNDDVKEDAAAPSNEQSEAVYEEVAKDK